MEHPILFLTVIFEKLGLHVPHGLPTGMVNTSFGIENFTTPHMSYTLLVMFFLITVSKMTIGKMEMIPGAGQNFWEAVISFIESFYIDTVGEENGRKLFPLLTTFAMYILVANLIGLMPGFMSPTSNLNITLGMTLIVWFYHHLLGLQKHGIKYINHFTGPMPVLIPLMLPIELISNLARILSLSIRLFGNIMAKETLLGILFLLAGAFFGPLPILCLGVLVSVIQTLVFVLLSLIYFKGALDHAH
jgi:F-type H+-transporting ATPase subunit a